MRILIFAGLIIGVALSASANQKSPYAGQEIRGIKALSQKEIDGYLSGKGMGYAKAAELNHYPGPRHVLDLSEQLALTREQKAKTKKLFESMKKQAVSLGRELIDREQELDRFFTNEAMDNKRLESILTGIGTLQAKLRYVHLSTHLQQKNILTPHQIQLYDRLRGYQSGSVHQNKHSHSH
jgi:Spy/CpxP family protein refolding chaperone